LALGDSIADRIRQGVIDNEEARYQAHDAKEDRE